MNKYWMCDHTKGCVSYDTEKEMLKDFVSEKPNDYDFIKLKFI